MLRFVKLMKLRNREFIQFFTDLISILLRHKPEELRIRKQLEPVANEIESIKSLREQGRGNSISDELRDIDSRRDDDITGIRTVVEGYTYHYDAETKEAAKLLLKTIDDFGPSIARQNYQGETDSLNGLINKFRNDEKCKNAVSLLHMNEWEIKMDDENKHFNTRYIDRLDENSKKIEEKTKELRATTTDYYYVLRNHLNAHATLHTETYKPVIDLINELIDDYNLVINRRMGGKNGEDEGEE